MDAVGLLLPLPLSLMELFAAFIHLLLFVLFILLCVTDDHNVVMLFDPILCWLTRHKSRYLRHTDRLTHTQKDSISYQKTGAAVYTGLKTVLSLVVTLCHFPGCFFLSSFV